MKDNSLKYLSMRIDKELLRRFYFVAKVDDRSMNWMLVKLVRECVSNYEAVHGIISDEELEKLEKIKNKQCK